MAASVWAACFFTTGSLPTPGGGSNAWIHTASSLKSQMYLLFRSCLYLVFAPQLLYSRVLSNHKLGPSSFILGFSLIINLALAPLL